MRHRGFGSSTVAFLIAAALCAPLTAAPMLVFFGTYTQQTSRGIYAAQFDPSTGSLADPFLASDAARNPTFLCLAPNGRFLYSTGEFVADAARNQTAGGVFAYRLDAAAGQLEFLNREPTGAGLTTHVAVDPSGRMVAVANYAAGYVAAVPILPDGRVGPRSAFFDHRGLAALGPDRSRQQQAHAHSVTFSPDGRFAYSCDLGLDRVFVYSVDPARAALAPADPPMVAAPPGVGPRHSKISADGRFLYVANEMGGSVCVYARDPSSGGLNLEQTASTLPPDFDPTKVTNTVGEIRIHPTGRFVYVSNRGDESIAVFERNAQTGLLRRIEIVNCGGKHPRNFALDPSGKWLLCANRDTDNVAVFSVDAETGRLMPTGRQIRISMPVCVLFVPSAL